ncbi:YicC/YloC family endoribonuclease [Acidicapsa ligni]|uniref:YicC/YloC family endoribonuclease n=1 Tax=Acidicapsa ligni TaxID=542300 RepID=UPI0021E0045B|nr:YicC/YloC family endoribonuclease [Acidicapsa ligni]
MSSEFPTAIAPVASSVSSMTGFARVAVQVNEQLNYTLTLKSVNHRFLDLQLRLPSGLDLLEMELRRILKASLLRGHVELALSVDRTAQQRGGYNRELVDAYVEAFQAAALEFELQGQPDLNVILRMPGVLQIESRSVDEDAAALTASVLQHVDALIASLKAMRHREGSALAVVLTDTLDRLSRAVNGVADLRPEVEARHNERLTQKLEAAIGTEINRQRLLEEVALLVERSDVSEEIARMHTHIQHFRDVLATGGETGKKLDFLLQEMNREANTLLSKTAGVAGKGTQITELGLAMKAEIEKAREQIMNLE